jgi:hypothetical protein
MRGLPRRAISEVIGKLPGQSIIAGRIFTTTVNLYYHCWRVEFGHVDGNDPATFVSFGKTTVPISRDDAEIYLESEHRLEFDLADDGKSHDSERLVLRGRAKKGISAGRGDSDADIRANYSKINAARFTIVSNFECTICSDMFLSLINPFGWFSTAQ